MSEMTLATICFGLGGTLAALSGGAMKLLELAEDIRTAARGPQPVSGSADSDRFGLRESEINLVSKPVQ
ncbi:MAG: hypothetical protein JO227_22095 [Acetobacteraceae bacterium]|nr:hypothetical protein [Acetobacteraceae bacterium]